MKYLLDTNIISELKKSECNPKVKSFIEKLPQEDIYISVITIGEISFGIEKLPAGKKKHELAIWLYTKIKDWFGDRIILLDFDIMAEWGKIRAKISRSIPFADSLIAASAISNHMTLVTRNIKDFKDFTGMMLINPWEL